MTDAMSYFRSKLEHETDASDAHAAQKAGEHFTIIDVRSEDAWNQGHIVGAVHMPYRAIADRAPKELDPTVPVVVYCWSPGCNAGAKGALEFAQLGYSVKEMIGGYEYWVREGFPTENATGPAPRIFDPLVMYVRPTTTA